MKFRFAQLTDTHLYGPPTVEAAKGKPFPDPFRDDIFVDFHREVTRHGIDFLVNTGDLLTAAAGGDILRYEHFHSLVQRVEIETGMPLRLVRGNHDAGRFTDSEYERLFGPGNYWFEHKGWAFLVVDHYFGTYEVQPDFYDLSPAALDRFMVLLAEIPRTMPMVVLLHQNPVGITHFGRGELFLDRLQPWNVRLLLFGHVQNNYISTYRGIPHATVVGECAAFDSAPLTYNIVTCCEDGTALCDFYPHTIHIPTELLSKPDALTPVGAAASAENWVDLAGPHGTRATRSRLPAKAPCLAWEVQVPGVIAVGPPTLFNDTLVIGSKTNGRFEQCVVQALDAASGALRWSVPVDAGVEAGVLLANGRAYAGTTAGSL